MKGRFISSSLLVGGEPAWWRGWKRKRGKKWRTKKNLFLTICHICFSPPAEITILSGLLSSMITTSSKHLLECKTWHSYQNSLTILNKLRRTAWDLSPSGTWNLKICTRKQVICTVEALRRTWNVQTCVLSRVQWSDRSVIVSSREAATEYI
jgi:hypothetical protein